MPRRVLITTDMEGVRRRKREMVDGLVAIHRTKFAVPHLEFVLGEGRLVGPRTVEARASDGGARRFVAERLFLNLGTHAAIPGVPGLAEAAPLTHVEALDLGRLPSHLVVLGARTTAVEGRSGERVRLRVDTPGSERTIEASDLLVAAGRTPNTRGIGLEAAGIALDERGFVQVDDVLRTTAPGVWAMGECAGSPQFTRVAFDDFRVVRDTLAGKLRSTRGRLVPSCAFIDPELARVGLDEATARRQGIAVRVARLPMAAVLRARASGETRGFMKVLVEAAPSRAPRRRP